MARTIEAKAVISAQDATGSVFDRLAAKIKGVNSAAKALGNQPALPKWLGNIDQDLAKYKLTQKQMDGVIRRQREMYDIIRGSGAATQMKLAGEWRQQELLHWKKVRSGIDEAALAQRRFHTSGGGFARAAGGLIGAGTGAYYAGRAGRYAFDRSKEANRETTKQRQTGLTQAQSDAISAEAERQSKNYPTVSQTEFRSAGREAVMQMGSQETGMRMMPTIGKFMTSGKVLWGEDKIDEQTRKALQILDARQITDPTRAESLLNSLVKSSQVEGGPDFKADDLRTALRYGRDMTRGQSDRFVTSVLPQLGVDMGYSQAGTGLASMHSALIGGRQKDAADQFQRKTGLRGKDGKLVDQKLFGSDVDRWFDKNYIPTLQKAGVDLDDAAAVAAFNSKFFSNRTAADVAGNFVSGRQQRVKRDEQQKNAKGMEGADTIHTRDVGAALEGVNAQLANMASSAKLAEASIASLNGAMGLIQEAGKRLNEPGGWFDEGKKKLENETRDAKAVGGVLGRVLEWDKKTGVNMGWVVPKWVRDRPYPQAEDPMTADQVPGSSYPMGDDPMGADYQRRQFHSKEYWRGLGRQGASWGDRKQMPAIGGDLGAVGGAGSSAPVQATLTGSADVTGEAALTIKIEAPELIKAYHDAQRAISMSGRLNTNGPGSTGRSSPDAQAPGGTGFGGGGM